MESQRLLASVHSEIDVDNSENESIDEEEWTEGTSYSSYSDSDSTIPDWEPYVDDFSGELLYIECHSFVVQNNKEKIQEPIEPFSKTQLRRSTRGKFLRLIRRRESKRRIKKNQKPTDLNEITTSKVKFQDFQEGEEKEVILDIDTENRHNLSSDKSLAESLLGLIVSTLSDGNRVMIAGFSYDSKAKHEKSIKIGDWLKSINNIDVNVQNLDDILQKFINKDNVFLKLQRVAGVEVTKDPPINELNNESNFVRELLNFKLEDEQLFLLNLRKHPIGIVFINTDKLNENNQDNEDVTYCFPKPLQKNILCSSRGMYITLNHLLNDITKTKPRTTTINNKGRLAHIVYSNFDKYLLLLMLPEDQASLQEIIKVNEELIKLFEFMYGTVDKCFSSQNHMPLDQFFSKFFARCLNGGSWITAQEFIETQDSCEMPSHIRKCHFESVMSLAPLLVLPDEAQMQIDDALTELEASDYREWDLLAVIMEVGGCTEAPEENSGPDAFYVEEAQATLAHIQELGLSEFAERYLSVNHDPQTTLPVPMPNKRKSDFINLNFSKINSSSSKDTSNLPKKNEVISILKRRSTDQNSLAQYSSNTSLQDDSYDGQSEESGSQGGYSERSEISDDSRRNTRKLKYDSNEEDSDTDEYGGSSYLSVSSFDISEIRQSLLTETEDHRFLQLTAGPVNVLYHFIQLDSWEGTLLCPVDCKTPTQTYEIILNNFRKCCQRIHSLFQTTLRFKNMPAPDIPKSVMNKSLIAIKEHGITFECPYFDDKEKKHKICYCVIGRLFYIPHPREFYICYQHGIPQNIVELVFKMNMASIG